MHNKRFSTQKPKGYTHFEDFLTRTCTQVVYPEAVEQNPIDHRSLVNRSYPTHQVSSRAQVLYTGAFIKMLFPRICTAKPTAMRTR